VDRLILILKRIAVPFLFIVIEIVAISRYSSATSFTRARLLSVSNGVTGAVNEGFSSVGDYFSLRSENEVLTQRILELESQLATAGEKVAGERGLSGENIPYLFSDAKVIKNRVFSQHNYFTINKGLMDDVEPNMAVLTPEGFVAGYVLECSQRYSVCMSVANRDFTMGGKGSHNDFMGSISWNGADFRFVALEKIPHYANFSKGDTIVSTVSYRFPPDRIVGFVEEFSPSEDKMNSNLKVRLAADLSQLDRVLLVKFMAGEEFEGLTSKYDKKK
jgi:rod shape-determining protein MreC